MEVEYSHPDLCMDARMRVHELIEGSEIPGGLHAEGLRGRCYRVPRGVPRLPICRRAASVPLPSVSGAREHSAAANACQRNKLSQKLLISA